MSEETLFHKIIRKEVPADIVYEDEFCLAIKDIAPQAPVHLLLIPKETLVNLMDATRDKQSLLGHLLCTASEVMKQQVGDQAYRVVINNGEQASQSVFQLHLHLLSGRAFSWPPG